MREIPRSTSRRKPERDLLLGGYSGERLCRRERGFFFVFGVCVRGSRTLVVLFVPSKTWALVVERISAPGNDNMIDIDGVVPCPEYPSLHPQLVAQLLQPGNGSVDRTSRKSGDRLDCLMGDPGMLAVDIGFGENCV